MAMQPASAGELLDSDLDAVARGEVVGPVGQLADELGERELDGMQIDHLLDHGPLYVRAYLTPRAVRLLTRPAQP